MERANVAVVRGAYDAFERGDLPAVFAALHPAIELAQSTEVPWGGVYRGHDGARAFFQALTARIRSRVAVERFVDEGDDVVAIGRTQGTVIATGQPFDVPIAHVWTIRAGLAVSVRFYIDDPAMREALALARSERAGP